MAKTEGEEQDKWRRVSAYSCSKCKFVLQYEAQEWRRVSQVDEEGGEPQCPLMYYADRCGGRLREQVVTVPERPRGEEGGTTASHAR